MAHSGVLRRLESEVTCPLCLDIFTEPKRLPCDHVYCRQCLRGLALRSINGSITCPECRTDTPVPPNFDVSQFATPHQVNRLIEMYQQNLKLAETEASAPEPATCKVHKSQALALYCETCKSLVCRDCVLLSCAKKNHEHGFIDEVVEKYQTELKKQVEPVRVLHRRLSNVLEVISSVEKELEDKKIAKLQHTESTFDALIETLAQEKQLFIESIKKSYKEQEDVTCTEKNKISEVLAKLESVIQSTESPLIDEHKPAFLGDMANKKQNIEHTMELERNLPSRFTAVLPEIQVELVSPAKFREDFHAANFLYKTGDSFNRGSESVVLDIPLNEIRTYDINISSAQVLALKARLLCRVNGSSEAVTIQKTTAEQYSLFFVSHTRGRHELHITHNDTHICGSPIPVYVTIQPHQLKLISSTTFHSTGAIKYYGGKLYVCDATRGLMILKSVTKSVEKIIKIPGLNEVLIIQEHIYATDIARNRVIKMDRNGNAVVKSIGEKGSSPGQFNFPNGIRLSKDKEIYVCDTDNHRIQVFDEDLNLVRVIGRYGTANNFFKQPADLDFDDTGNIYVTELQNHRIQVLTPEGRHIRNIGRPGARPGELNRPVSPAIHRNMLYVTESFNRRISVFRLTGEFVATFGHDLSRPECIAIDEDGYIYVTNDRQAIVTF